VRAVHDRYGGGDLIITETGHEGEGRAPWLRSVAQEAAACLEDGLPLHGVCLYPILGMPEWHAQDRWVRMGLWDPEPDLAHASNSACTGGRRLRRVPCTPMLDALSEAQQVAALGRACAAEQELLEEGRSVAATAV
jgi:hypothetical protein